MLTDVAIRKLKLPPKDKKAPDKYPFGNGLRLFVYANGKKIWFIDYQHNGKPVSWRIGVYPEMSLAEALTKRDEAKVQRDKGIDPKALEKSLLEEQATINTFETVANEWLTSRNELAESTLKKTTWLLSFAIAEFGQFAIDQITPATVLKACRKEEAKGHLETAQRIKVACSQVFRYAVSNDILSSDPTRDLAGALKTPQVTHRAAITDIRDIPNLLRDIDQYEGDINTVQALKLAPLVFIRPGELRGALWDDIDLERGEWLYTPPKTRNKTKLQLIVPLAKQTINIFKKLKEVNGHTPYVFYSSSATIHGIMSENTVNQALRRMGYSKEQMCGHGFRALAYTTLKGQLRYSDEVIELQLGHQIRNIHGRAYDRWSYLDERKEMMQRWADYLDELREGQAIQFTNKIAR